MHISDEQYFLEYKKIEDEFYLITTALPTNFPKAINLQDEKKKFFKALEEHKEYNPQILFTTKNYSQSTIKKLENFHIDVSDDIYGFKHLLRDRLHAKLNEVYCHNSWGLPKSTNYVLKYRGQPSKKLLESAVKFVKQYKRKKIKFKTLTAEIAGDRLQKEVFRLTGDTVNVIFNENLTSKMNISPKKKILNINPKERFTSLDVKRLKVHEIGTHYMRNFNGRKFDLKILESGTANYIETEEGLAAYMEYKKGVSSDAQMFIYAGRVIATHYALSKSFYEVYSILKKYKYKNSDAFSITYRSKRNLCDTSKPGGFTKDYVYYSGFYKIKNYVNSGYDLKKLFIGKIKIEDLEVLTPFIEKHLSSVETILN
jgi:hypothetical protein